MAQPSDNFLPAGVRFTLNNEAYNARAAERQHSEQHAHA